MKYSCIPSREYKSRIDRLLDDGLGDKIVTAYKGGGKVSQISVELDVSVAVIYRILHENGIRAFHHDNSRDESLSEKKSSILELHQQGIKPKEIMVRLKMRTPKLIYEVIKNSK